MQFCNQQKVAENVDDTGNQNKQKRFLFPKITGNENCNSHCKLRYYKGDQIQYLASGGNRGKSGGGAKAAHYQKIYSTVSGLQNQCAQNRKGNC